MPGRMRKAAVIGIGNHLMGDDGAGVAVLDLLAKKVHRGVEILDLGTGGMALLHKLEGLDLAIIVDAADFGGKPGEISIFEPDDVDTTKAIGVSLHDADILKIIQLAKEMGKCPDKIFIAAIQPASVSPTMEISPAVKKKLPELADEILKLLKKK
jgi:hydrogenase maturation protease